MLHRGGITALITQIFTQLGHALSPIPKTGIASGFTKQEVSSRIILRLPF